MTAPIDLEDEMTAAMSVGATLRSLGQAIAPGSGGYSSSSGSPSGIVIAIAAVVVVVGLVLLVRGLIKRRRS